jgi:uncharacterized protein YaaN involved in tellurite resistance
MTTGTAQPIQIAFPVPKTVNDAPLAVVAPPAAPISQGLETFTKTPDTRQQLSCSALLRGETRARAEAEAAKVLPAMLGNSQVVMTYGADALTGVNTLIRRLLKEIDPVKIPELTEIMRELNSGMRRIRSKYDVSDPEVREKYEKWKGGVLRFIGKGKTLIEMLMEDVSSIETQLGRVEEQLTGRQMDMLRNVAYYDQLYAENEQEITQLIYVIGVMELIRDLAARQAAEIVVGDAQLGDRGGERKAELAQFVNNLEIKIGDYKGRLFVAWAMAPQVRMMRTLDISVAQKLHTMVNVAIPTMLATIVQWRMLIQTRDAAEMGQLVAEATNESLQAFAAAGAELVPAIARTVQTPMISPQTVGLMAASIETQAKGIVEAMNLGTQWRDEADAAMIEGVKVMADANAHVSDSLIDRVLEISRRELPIEITTSVVSDPPSTPPAGGAPAYGSPTGN